LTKNLFSPIRCSEDGKEKYNRREKDKKKRKGRKIVKKRRLRREEFKETKNEGMFKCYYTTILWVMIITIENGITAMNKERSIRPREKGEEKGRNCVYIGTNNRDNKKILIKLSSLLWSHFLYSSVSAID